MRWEVKDPGLAGCRGGEVSGTIRRMPAPAPASNQGTT